MRAQTTPQQRPGNERVRGKNTQVAIVINVDDIRLFSRLATCRQIAELGGGVALGPRCSIVLSLGARPLAIWGLWQGNFVLRGLSNYEPLHSTPGLDEAHQLSVGLLQLCQHGWAEGLGWQAETKRAA